MAKAEKKQRSPINAAIAGFFCIIVVKQNWPHFIPFGMFQFWETDWDVAGWFKSSWPLFAWGTALTLLFAIARWRQVPPGTASPKEILGGGLIISLSAGVLEEICFRWLIFLSTIVWIQVTNFFFFGWLGFGVPEMFYIHILMPITDFTTFGYLEGFLHHPYGWAVGAALLSANGFFRDGHKYQGLVGIINSWCGGMLLFYIMLKHGLVASITIHFSYDFTVFGWAALITALRNRLR